MVGAGRSQAFLDTGCGPTLISLPELHRLARMQGTRFLRARAAPPGKFTAVGGAALCAEPPVLLWLRFSGLQSPARVVVYPVSFALPAPILFGRNALQQMGAAIDMSAPASLSVPIPSGARLLLRAETEPSPPTVASPAIAGAVCAGLRRLSGLQDARRKVMAARTAPDAAGWEWLSGVADDAVSLAVAGCTAVTVDNFCVAACGAGELTVGYGRGWSDRTVRSPPPDRPPVGRLVLTADVELRPDAVAEVAVKVVARDGLHAPLEPPAGHVWVSESFRKGLFPVGALLQGGVYSRAGSDDAPLQASLLSAGPGAAPAPRAPAEGPDNVRGGGAEARRHCGCSVPHPPGVSVGCRKPKARAPVVLRKGATVGAVYAVPAELARASGVGERARLASVLFKLPEEQRDALLRAGDGGKLRAMWTLAGVSDGEQSAMMGALDAAEADKAADYVQQARVAAALAALPPAVAHARDSVRAGIMSRADLNPEQQRQLLDVLDRHHATCFAPKLGVSSLLRMRIETAAGCAPVCKPAHRTALALRAVEREAVDKMLAQGVVEHSDSAWRAPLLMVPKPHGRGWRLCVDFRGLNKVTLNVSAVVLPRVDECLQRAAQGRLWSTLDLEQAFHQMQVEPADRHKTAFAAQDGRLFQFCRVPMGATGAPAALTRLMALVMHGLPPDWAQAYLDDICCWGDDFASALRSLDAVLGRLVQHGLTLNIAKCHFIEPEVAWLGHVLGPQGITTDPRLVSVVRSWPQPRTRKALRQFLGLANVFRGFLSHASELLAPLHAEASVKRRFAWSAELEAQRQAVIKAITSAPAVVAPELRDGELSLMTDASSTCLGAVLYFTARPGTRSRSGVVGFASKALSPAQGGYDTVQRELKAVHWALGHFRHFLLGQHFRLFSDHKPLCQLLNDDFSNSALLTRWSWRLMEFQFSAAHRPGKRHLDADALTRWEVLNPGVLPADADPRPGWRAAGWGAKAVPAPTVPGQSRSWAAPVFSESESAELLRAGGPIPDWAGVGASADASTAAWGESISASLTGAAIGAASRESAEAASLLRSHRSGGITFARQPDGSVVRSVTLSGGRALRQVFLPTQSMRAAALWLVHDGRAGGGHTGAVSSFKKLQSRYYWPGYEADAREWVSGCVACAQRERAHKPNATGMGCVPIPAKPWDTVVMDTLTLPRHKVIIFTDVVTRWAEVAVRASVDAATVAEAFISEVVGRHGAPAKVLSDLGSEFNAAFVDAVLALLGTDHLVSSGWRPQTAGQVERLNRTLIALLSKAAGGSATWERELPLILFSYHATPHTSTGVSPFAALYGREPRLPGQDLSPADRAADLLPRQSERTRVRQLQRQLRGVHAGMRAAAERTQERRAAAAQEGGELRKYPVGSLVMVFMPAADGGMPAGVGEHKLQRLWAGPFVVLSQGRPASPSPLNLRIAHPRRGVITVHYQRVKAFVPNPLRLHLMEGGAAAAARASRVDASVRSQLAASEDELVWLDGHPDMVGANPLRAWTAAHGSVCASCAQSAGGLASRTLLCWSCSRVFHDSAACLPASWRASGARDWQCSDCARRAGVALRLIAAKRATGAARALRLSQRVPTVAVAPQVPSRSARPALRSRVRFALRGGVHPSGRVAEVERVVDFRTDPDGLRVRVRWAGTAASADTWVFAAGIPAAVINTFRRSLSLAAQRAFGQALEADRHRGAGPASPPARRVDAAMGAALDVNTHSATLVPLLWSAVCGRHPGLHALRLVDSGAVSAVLSGLRIGLMGLSWPAAWPPGFQAPAGVELGSQVTQSLVAFNCARRGQAPYLPAEVQEWLMDNVNLSGALRQRLVLLAAAVMQGRRGRSRSR